MALGGVGAAVARYADVVRVPGAALPVVGTVLATFPIGMLGLSVLLMVQQSSAGFSGAGLVVGALGLGTGLGMAFQGRLIDLFGQPRVLIPMATIQLVLLVLLVVAVGSDWPVWVICLVAFGAGVGEPQVGASLRSLWVILVGPEQRHVATALSSILFEAPIIVAPLLLAAVLVVANPSFGVLLAGGCFTAGAYLLSASKASRSWKPVLQARGRLLGALVSKGVRTVVLVGFGQGILTAMAQVPSAAFAAGSGAPEHAPVLYGALSVGSLIGTFAYGLRRWAGRAWVRLVLLLSSAASALALCAVMPSLPLLALSVFLVGVSVGPVAVCYFGLLEDLAPRGTLTEAFTAVTSVALGSFAASAAVAGIVIDRFGVPWAFGMGFVAMALTALVVVARRRTLEPADRT